MKKNIFCFAVLIWLLSTPVLYGAGDALNGKVIQENEKFIELELVGGGSLETGKEIELSYMAGVMEMLIGRFKVARATGNRYELAVINLNMRPSSGMNVKIVPAMDLGNFIMTNSSYPQPQASTGNASAAGEIQGEVSDVSGDDVSVELKTAGVPAVGDLAEIKYVTGSGMEMEVGTWKVTSINGNQVKATAVKKLTQPRKGLQVIFKPNLADPSAGVPLAVASTPLYANSPLPAPRQDVVGSPSAGESITLLGVSAGPSTSAAMPSQGAYAGPTDQNLFSPTYGQPLTPEAQKQQAEYYKQLKESSIQAKMAALKQRGNV